MQDILNILFTPEEQTSLANELRDLVRQRLREKVSPPVQAVPVVVEKTKRKRRKLSPEAHAASVARMADLRARRMAKRAAQGLPMKLSKPPYLSKIDFKILKAMQDGHHWPSEIGRAIESSAGLIRMTNACDSLVNKGVAIRIAAGKFDITEMGKRALSEPPAEEGVEEGTTQTTMRVAPAPVEDEDEDPTPDDSDEPEESEEDEDVPTQYDG